MKRRPRRNHTPAFKVKRNAQQAVVNRRPWTPVVASAGFGSLALLHPEERP
jgi:hypothetical protein